MRQLTKKQEDFVLAWVETGNKTEAYRRAYNTANMAEETINVKASLLSNKGNVRARYDEYMQAARDRTNTTVDSLDAMLKTVFQKADDESALPTMVSAINSLMKLHGLDAETRHKIQSDSAKEDPAPLTIKFTVREPVGEIKTTNARPE